MQKDDKLRRKIIFILNPISGVSKKSVIEDMIHMYIDSNQFDYVIKYTDHPNHGTEIAREAVKDGYDMVVAVGGDGSVNEVSEGLIGSDVILGIIPAGSGNGYAMYLGIGREIKKAIKILNKGKVRVMDTGSINQQPFVNLAGIGFDAKIAYLYRNVKRRGFWGYFKTAVKETVYFRFHSYSVIIDGKEILKEKKCFTIVVANAPMYGYGFIIAPKARPDDGKLEVVIFHKAPLWRIFFSLWRFLNHSMDKTRIADRYSGETVEIICHEDSFAHTDGEGFTVSGTQIFTIRPKSLRVWTGLIES
ncbi:MAG: diacylglycerol/lipid kinase family protein [Saprospiraceae bacterium]